ERRAPVLTGGAATHPDRALLPAALSHPLICPLTTQPCQSATAPDAPPFIFVLQISSGVSKGGGKPPLAGGAGGWPPATGRPTPGRQRRQGRGRNPSRSGPSPPPGV